MDRKWVEENSQNLINKRKLLSQDAEAEYDTFKNDIYSFCDELF